MILPHGPEPAFRDGPGRIAARLEPDVSERDELFPRGVAPKQLRHARHAVDRQVASVHGLESEERQTQVMPDVGVGQEHPLQRSAIEPAGFASKLAHRVELLANIRSGVDEIDLVGVGKADRETRNPSVPGGIVPGGVAARAIAGGVREATVLDRAENADERS